MKQSGNKQPDIRKRPQPDTSRTPAARTGQPGPNSPNGPMPAGEAASEASDLGGFRSAYWILAPLRLFLGVTFVYAGLQKFGDPQFFNPTAAGYIGKQIIAFSHDYQMVMIFTLCAIPLAIMIGSTKASLRKQSLAPDHAVIE